MTGTLALAVSEPGAEIAVDGRPAGTSPLARPLRVAAGAHRIRIAKPGFAPHEEEVAIGAQEDRRLEIVLRGEKQTGRGESCLLYTTPSPRD